MYIENIKIGNFGKLSSREFDLKSGVNIIEGKNESGKTTLGEFIKFIFYGLSNKNSDGEMSERKRHISWKENEASGSLVLNCDGKRYRIERFVTPHGAGYRDSVSVVDMSSNSVVEGIKNVGEFFFGLPEDVFTSTIYVRQADGAAFNGESIGQAVENIFYSADESVNTEKALKKLDEARVQLKHKKNTGRGLLDSLEKERDSLSLLLSEARYANEQILKNEDSLHNTKNSIEKNKKDCEVLASKVRKKEISSILGKFSELKKYTDALSVAEKKKHELKSALNINGFCPDEQYYNDLTRLKNELVYIKNGVSEFDIPEEDFGVSDEKIAVFEKLKENGGGKCVEEKILTYKTKTKTFGLCACILGFVTFCSAVCAFLFGKISSLVLALSAGGVALCGTLTFMCLYLALKNKRSANALVSEFCNCGEEDLSEVLSQYTEYEDMCLKSEEMRKYLDKKRDEAEENVDRTSEKICELLAKWGVRTSDSSYDSVLKNVNDVLGGISKINERIAQFDREIDMNNVSISILKSQLSSYDYEALREEYDSIGFDVADEDGEELKRKYDFTLRARDALTQRLTELEKSLAESRAKTYRPAELESRLRIVEDKYNELSFKYDAYVLAYEKLQNAGVALRGKLAPGLSYSAGRLMDELTDGKYKEIGVSDKLKLTYSFEEDGAYHTKQIDCVSSGTKDIAYVSLRLALAELFSKNGKKIPVVFDEAFARLDDGRLCNMLSIAEKYASDNCQAIVLTSQTREAEIMKAGKCGDGFSYITM